jgi:argininosuccinate lyase
MDQLSVKELQGVDSRFGDDVKLCFDYTKSVENRTAKGGCSKSAVREQIAVMKQTLEGGKSA